MCGHTRGRYLRALVPTDRGAAGRDFDPNRYRAVEDVRGAVLLVDDTWTSGGHAQSAAYALREEAGAASVGCAVIGRHVHRNFAATATILKDLPPFSWDTCMVH